MSTLPTIRFEGFFDRAEVEGAMSKAKRRELSRAGAFIRRRARSSIRRRANPSKPGQAPTNWTGTLKNGILFSYDKGNDSVVVGPVAFQLAGGRTGAQTLEFGGEITFRRPQTKREWGPDGEARAVPDYSAPFLVETVSSAPRPYMRPALEKELPNLAPRFRNALGGS